MKFFLSNLKDAKNCSAEIAKRFLWRYWTRTNNGNNTCDSNAFCEKIFIYLTVNRQIIQFLPSVKPNRKQKPFRSIQGVSPEFPEETLKQSTASWRLIFSIPALTYLERSQMDVGQFFDLLRFENRGKLEELYFAK
jgi:hypothetical protein